MLARSVGLISLGLAGFAVAGTIYPANNGFEFPDSGTKGYSYANQDAGTTNKHFSNTYTASQTGFAFVGAGAGVAANGSAFGVTGATNGNNDGPDGALSTMSTSGQAAFLQGGDGTITGNGADYISQTITIPAGQTGTSINFVDEQRGGGSVSENVYVDSMLVNLTPLTPASTGSFGPESVAVSLSAGDHTIAIAGDQLAAGDRTSFIDNVSITTTPEPAALGFLCFAGLGLLSRRRKA